ncbi:MAG: N-acetylmuramoyl-L-alanine amidase, partial [Bacteroidota bacterium]
MQKLTIFLLLTFLWSFAEAQEPLDSSVFVVVLDPGHGGKDPGRLSSHPEKYYHEKNIVLPIARKVQTYINERMPNAKAFLTRNADSTVSLDSRTWQANQACADVFVSIHCNSNPLTDIKGTRVHIQSRAFKESFRLAKIMREQLADRARRYD